MSTDRDTTRIVRSWLRTDEHESADRVLDDVLARLDATPQRRPLWPARRIADMNSFAKFAIAAAAVLVVAVVGYNLLPGSRDVGVGPAVSPSPSATSSPSPSPAASSTAEAFPPAGALEIGRHALTQNDVAFTLDISTSGWFSSGLTVPPDGGTLKKGTIGQVDSAWMLIWSIDGVYTDPCGHVAGPPVSPSATDLAAAVAAMPGVDVITGPVDVTLDGLPAKHVAITVREDVDCDASDFYLWYDDVQCDGDDPCPRWASALGQTSKVWIIEVDGTHVWIEAETYKGASPELEQEIQQIVDSIRFE
jgi:hypothetical protein